MKTELCYANLDSMLGQFDGRHTDFLDRIATDHPATLPSLLDLARFAEEAGLLKQTAATALLKRYLTGGFCAPPALVERALDLLAAVAGWEARLHLLQLLPTLSVPGARAEPLCRYLLSLLDDPNKFVRAWAYNGLHHLAGQHAGYRPRVTALLEKAAREEAASVRARLRHLPPFAPLPVASSRPGRRPPHKNRLNPIPHEP